MTRQPKPQPARKPRQSWSYRGKSDLPRVAREARKLGQEIVLVRSTNSNTGTLLLSESLRYRAKTAGIQFQETLHDGEHEWLVRMGMTEDEASGLRKKLFPHRMIVSCW